jgi:proteasome lid subunit RPN8/RPN11
MAVRRVDLHLPPEMTEQIVAHAQAGYPEEVCGLVAGRDGAALAVCAGRNVSPTPTVAYEMDVETLMRMVEWEDAGLELLAIYHSHPQGPEGPSETDVAQATYPNAAYIIVSLAERGRPVVRAFRLTVEV